MKLNSFKGVIPEITEDGVQYSTQDMPSHDLNLATDDTEST